MVRSEEHGPLVDRAATACATSTNDTVDGDDPLEVFGPHTADNLRRLDGFEHIGDIFIISMYDPSTEEIAPFEHQVGAHGGLGGNQTKAFVLYPAALERQDEARLARRRRVRSTRSSTSGSPAREELDAMGATEAAGEAAGRPAALGPPERPGRGLSAATGRAPRSARDGVPRQLRHDEHEAPVAVGVAEAWPLVGQEILARAATPARACSAGGTRPRSC